MRRGGRERIDVFLMKGLIEWIHLHLPITNNLFNSSRYKGE